MFRVFPKCSFLGVFGGFSCPCCGPSCFFMGGAVRLPHFGPRYAGCSVTSLLTFAWQRPDFRIPESSQIGITLFFFFFFLLELMQRFPLFKIYSRPSADQRKRHLLHPGSKSGPYTRNFVTRQSPMFFIYLIYLFSYVPKSPSARATRTSRRAAETERLRRVRIKLFNVQSRNHTLLSVLQKDFCSVISPLARNYGVHVLRVSMELRVAPLTVF